MRTAIRLHTGNLLNSRHIGLFNDTITDNIVWHSKTSTVHYCNIVASDNICQCNTEQCTDNVLNDSKVLLLQLLYHCKLISSLSLSLSISLSLFMIHLKCIVSEVIWTEQQTLLQYVLTFTCTSSKQLVHTWKRPCAISARYCDNADKRQAGRQWVGGCGVSWLGTCCHWITGRKLS